MRVRVRRRGLVLELVNPFYLPAARLGDEAHLVSGPCEMTHDMDILAGKVLMNEEKPHPAAAGLKAVAHRSNALPRRTVISTNRASVSTFCNVRAVNPVRWAMNVLPRAKEAVCPKIMSRAVIGPLAKV